MNNMIPIVAETNNNAVAGLYIIILIIYAIFTVLSIWANMRKKKKLIRAKELIEEGHEKKQYEEAWKNHEKSN